MKILLKENSDIGNAHKKYIAFTRDEELVDAYEAHMKWKRDYNTGIDYAMREGQKQGLIKGEKQGLIKGEKNSQLSIAKTMLDKGYDVDTISSITGLTLKELKGLR